MTPRLTSHVIDQDGRTVETIKPSLFNQVMKPSTVRAGEGASGLAFERRDAVSVDDYGTWNLAVPANAGLVKSALSVPLLVGDRAIGALTAASLRPRAWER